MGKVVAQAIMSLDGDVASRTTPSAGDVLVGHPTVCVQGDRVTHLASPWCADRRRRRWWR